MIWVEFIITSAIIVFLASQLAKYGDVIAIRTRLGGMFIGILLMAAATSLPELLTSINALYQNSPNLAAGNLLGSNLYNMFLIALLAIVSLKHRILRKAALKHALTGSLAVFLIGLVLFLLMAQFEWKIGWVGVDSILIIMVYVIAVWLIQDNVAHHAHPHPGAAPSIPEDTPRLRTGIIGFSIAAAALIIVTPIMVQRANDIADITGLGTTFIGTTLVALVTSLPETATVIAAIRISADDMAIGNLFGSNMFNMFAVGVTDIFYTQGRFLTVIDPSFMLVGLIGLLMTGMGLIGNLAKLEKRILFIELDALAIIVVFFSSLWLLYLRS